MTGLPTKDETVKTTQTLNIDDLKADAELQPSSVRGGEDFTAALN